MTDDAGRGRAGKLTDLVEQFSSYQKPQKRAKHNRTLSLDSENFLKLQNYCREKGIPVNSWVDHLIKEFLDALEAQK